MWTRFVQDPPTVSAVLTIKELHPTSAPQLQLPQAPSTSPTTPGVASSAAAPAAALAEVELSPGELGALLQELMAVLPAAAASAATTHDTVGAGEGAGAAALGTPGARPVGLLPLSDGRLQLTVSGVVVAVLSPGHVSSLVTVLDDVVMQMPGQFDPPDLAVEVCALLPLPCALHAPIPPASTHFYRDVLPNLTTHAVGMEQSSRCYLYSIIYTHNTAARDFLSPPHTHFAMLPQPAHR